MISRLPAAMIPRVTSETAAKGAAGAGSPVHSTYTGTTTRLAQATIAATAIA